MPVTFGDILTAAIKAGKDDHQALDAALAAFPSKTPKTPNGWLALYRRVHYLRTHTSIF